MAVNTYDAELLAWRDSLDQRLRAEDGWLTLAGLHWLNEGDNTVGSDPMADIPLPENAPPHLGAIHFAGGRATLTTTQPVLVDGVETTESVLKPDVEGATLVKTGSITFFVIKRADQYGIRVRDSESPARQTFTGRRWYDPRADHNVTATYTAHPDSRSINIINSVGLVVPMENPGVVEFTLNGQPLRLEAFKDGDQGLWFLFKDATNGKTTYGSGRFLTAPFPDENGTVTLDFNRAYSPPCAFTPYATCPLAPRENVLPVAVEAGELY